MIPYTRFKLLVEEIAQELKDEIPSHFFGNYKFEKNAVIALQIMTKHVVVIFFEMMYILR